MPTSAGLKPDAVFMPTTDATGARLDRIAWLMDRAIPIPGTPFSVGLDALLGLLPVGGDLITGTIQAGLVLTAIHHYRVPRAVVARMVANVLLDIAVGAIPFAGDLFDVVFKANSRNMALLPEARRHAETGGRMPSAPSLLYLLGIAAIFGLALAAAMFGMVALIVWIVRQPWL